MEHFNCKVPQDLPTQNFSTFLRCELPDIVPFILTHSRVRYWEAELLYTQTPHQTIDKINHQRQPHNVLGEIVPTSVLIPHTADTASSSFKDHALQAQKPNPCALASAVASKHVDSDTFEEMIQIISWEELLKLGLNPSFYSTIIDWSVEIAFVLLKKIAKTNDNELYFKQFFCQSPHNSSRLLNSLRLITDAVFFGINLPKDFLNHFIHVVLHTCNNMQEYPAQQRVARLICVFLLNFIQAEAVKPTDDIVAEIQTFCVAWIRLKEAGDVFRTLKRLTTAFS